VSTEDDEFLVVVTFYGRGWAMAVEQWTSPETPDEVRALAAAEVFAMEHGFDPGLDAVYITVEGLL
jgi:hypothetical protein